MTDNAEFINPIDAEKVSQNPGTLPYAHNVGGFVIKPTKEGVIRSKALSAMEDQTDMQLDQIKKQIELLAQQANEIQQRKEISYLIYQSKMNFQPLINKEYYVYEKQEGEYVLSMIGPSEWRKLPFKKFIAKVKLLADHTWLILEKPEVD